MTLKVLDTVREIKVPLLRCSVLLFTGRHQVEHLEDENGMTGKLELWDSSFGAVSHVSNSDNGSNYFMMFIRQADHLVVVHECSHAVTMLMKYCGIECDEMRSRILEHLFKKVCKAVGLECLG